MKVVFSSRAYAAVMAETTEKIKTETGGLFLGAYANDAWYIVEAIDPGPKSIFKVAYFEYDQAYTQHLIRKIANLYEVELHLIGLWHRHPGSFDVFSSTDDATNAKYAQLNSRGAISALINVDQSFRITMYHVDRPCKYTKISYEVGDSLIPADYLRFKSPKHFDSLMNRLLHPKDASSAMEEKHHESVSFSFFINTILPYMDEHVCDSIVPEPSMDEQAARDRMIDELIDDIGYLSDDVGAEIIVLQNGKYIVLARETVDEITKLYFAYAENEDRVIFEYNGKCYYYQRGLFRNLFENALKAKKEKIAIRTIMNKARSLPIDMG